MRHLIKYTHKEACNYPTQLGEFIAKNGFDTPCSQAFFLNINHNKREENKKLENLISNLISKKKSKVQ